MEKDCALPKQPAVLKKEFNCNICNKTGFSTRYKLMSHMFIHNAVPPRFSCDICMKSFYRSDAYNRHMNIHKKNQKLHECEYCERTFADKRNLKIHLLNVHDEIPTSNLRYQCLECGVNYCEERLIKHHIRKAHLKISKEPSYVLKNLNETWIEGVKDTKNCVQITKIQPNKITIKSCDIKTKSDVKTEQEMSIFQKYKASEFASKENYYSNAVCDYCGKEMLKKSIVVHIREKHMKLRRFGCEYCGRTFKRHYQLCLHRCKVVKDEAS